MDDLLGEAQERLRQQQEEEDNPNAELGDSVDLAEGEHHQVRWRGEGVMHTKDRGQVRVYLVWDTDGTPRFHYQRAALVEEVQEQRPEVGDEVLILRGPDKTWEQDGEPRTKHRYVLRRRPCSDPLPGAELETAAESAKEGPLGPDEELPFLCPGGDDPRSAPTAAAATV